MLLEKLKKKEDFTPADAAIAEYLLNHPSFASTSTDLAKKANTSQAAVIRLVRKTGFASYKEFILTFSLESRERERNSVIHLEKPFTSALQISEAQKSVQKIYDEVLKEADAQIDQHLLQRLINRIRSSHMIDVYGTGISGIYAEQLAFDLAGLNYPCRYMSGANAHYLQNADNVHTMAIVYSFTGESAAMIDLVNELSVHHIWTAGLIGRPNTSLCNKVDMPITFSPDYYRILDNLSFELAAMYLNHLIYSLLVSRTILSSR